MSKLHAVSMNGEQFHARSGQVLLDAALVSGIEFPHDCRAGRCGTCVTRVGSGLTLGGETKQPGMVHACQARVFSDLDLSIEALPSVVHIEARILQLEDVTADVVDLTIAPSEPFDFFPGQYCRFAFRGFPERAFSPTAALDGQQVDVSFHLNIKRVRQGRVSTKLGGSIKRGHPLIIHGPFGHAFLRPGTTNRLVLVAGGTGFAPMWAVADAALRENPQREIVLIAGTRELKQLYMGQALMLASRFPRVEVIATTEVLQSDYPLVQHGKPADHVPQLRASDCVYAAGAPQMVDAVGKLAIAAKATFYSDPFEPAGAQAEDWLTKAIAWMK
jgi:CDP-4-dehydro-6-deoxyglucose reductase, E3